MKTRTVIIISEVTTNINLDRIKRDVPFRLEDIADGSDLGAEEQLDVRQVMVMVAQPAKADAKRKKG